MATEAGKDRISLILGGAATLLRESDRFNYVATFDDPNVDPLPAATMWWEGFDTTNPRDPPVASFRRVTAFRFTLMLWSEFDLSHQQESEEHFRALVQDAVALLGQNPTLNGTCLASLVTSGRMAEIRIARGRQALGCPLTLIADHPGPW